MNHYYTSDGDRISQATLDRRIRNAKAKVKADAEIDGRLYCWECGTTYRTLHMSHTISVQQAKNERRSELCWSESNIRILCDRCHQMYDKLSIAPWGVKQTK